MPDEREKLLKEWLKFKKSEDKAKKSRVEVENQIIELYGTAFEKNSKSFKEEELGFKTTLKKNFDYKLDQEKWIEARNNIEQNLRPEKIKFDLDVKGFNWLKKNNHNIYKIVSDCVEIKENKTTVKVEKI